MMNDKKGYLPKQSFYYKSLVLAVLLVLEIDEEKESPIDF